jgi:hypothetical protein
VPSKRELEALFPNLIGAQWEIASPFDTQYNCIAWAACETHRRWWPAIYPPLGGDLDHWPPGIPREETIPCFVLAFRTLGYEPCGNGNFWFGHEKVAIYADRELTPTHVARQRLFGGGWLSKLGDYEDIYHRQLRDVEGDISPLSTEYGTVVQYLKRSWLRTFQHWRARRKVANEKRKPGLIRS